MIESPEEIKKTLWFVAWIIGGIVLAGLLACCFVK